MVSLRLDSGKLCGAPSLRTIHRSELLARDHAQSPAPALDGKGQPLLGAIGNQPPYFSGGQRRGLAFGLSTHRSFGRDDDRTNQREKKAARVTFGYIPRWLDAAALYPRPERRGFTALRGVNARQQLHEAREYCWSHAHKWWDEDSHRWHTDRDWDDHDHDHDHDRH